MWSWEHGLQKPSHSGWSGELTEAEKVEVPVFAEVRSDWVEARGAQHGLSDSIPKQPTAKACKELSRSNWHVKTFPRTKPINDAREGASPDEMHTG